MNRLLAVVSSIALTSAVSCKVQEDDSPDLPPAASLSVNIAAIAAAPLAAKNAPTGTTATPADHLNFANAWARVKIVQFFAGLVVVLPATAMGLAVQTQPVQTGNLWEWTVTVGETGAKVALTADLATGFDVELHVTNPTLENYLWVEGNFGDGSGTGEWTLHDPNIESGNDSALSIQWSYVSDTDRSLTYEILSPRPNDLGEVFAGDTFTFSVDGTTATLEYEDADDPGVVAIITWDTVTGTGSIKVPGFNAGAAACWDTLFENIDC